MSDFRSLLHLTSASAANAVSTIDLFNKYLESKLALELELNMRQAIWLLGDLVRGYLLPKGVEQMKVEPGAEAQTWPWVDGFRNDIKKVRDLYEPLSQFKGRAPFWPTISGTLTALMKYEKPHLLVSRAPCIIGENKPHLYKIKLLSKLLLQYKVPL
ncbi:hypothetical protein [Shimazuella kribbensis]|uniref:hypothetical protein n=1 Tax=Shimazuella kribbensis TaxID=139808 RepID=UPI000428D74B|nr:hypothetical protein [Shimazuella kribbensis]